VRSPRPWRGRDAIPRARAPGPALCRARGHRRRASPRSSSPGFFRNPAGLLDSVSAFSIYLSRGIEPGPHVQPWFYYLQTLAWSSSGGLVWTDALVLLLAAAGIAHAIAVRKTAFWPLYIGLYSIGTMAIFSAVRYKTPWNALPFYAGIILMAGIGAAALVSRTRHRPARILLVVALVAAGSQLAWQSVRASFQSGRYATPHVHRRARTSFG
jgi:hypothetical protein